MDGQTPVVTLPRVTLPALPKLSEVTKAFWLDLLARNGSVIRPDSVGGKPW
jgi:hypothetical protein